MRAAVSAGVGLAPRFVVPVADAGFYRTQSGKIQRGKFKKELLSGEYRTAVTALDAPALTALDLGFNAVVGARRGRLRRF